MTQTTSPDRLTISSLSAIYGVRHAYFGRDGGVSKGLYTSLNCGFGSSDETNNVAKNRERAMKEIGLEADRLVTAYQVHSNVVARVDRPWRREDAPKADAMVTREPGLALGILTADCVPILLADRRAKVIGAAHAGWRGALDGIAEAVISAMVELGAQREAIVAGIGPAIGNRSYEVGPEFPAPFLEQAAENTVFFKDAPREGHSFFDIKAYVARQLMTAGLGEVQALPCDTCAEESLYFSYRRSCHRGETDYGRGLSTIALEP